MIPIHLKTVVTGPGTVTEEAKNEVLMFTRTSVHQGSPASTWSLAVSGEIYFYIMKTTEAAQKGFACLYTPNDADLRAFIQKTGPLFLPRPAAP